MKCEACGFPVDENTLCCGLCGRAYSVREYREGMKREGMEDLKFLTLVIITVAILLGLTLLYEMNFGRYS